MNVNECQISNCEPKTNEPLKTEIKQEPPKPKEPEKPKDELSEKEKKIIEVLKANNGEFKSENKLAEAIGFIGSGESIIKLCNPLVDKGYLVIERGSYKTSPKTFRLTEKGKSYHPA